MLLNEEIRSILRTAELLLEVNLGATAIGTRLNTPDGYQQLAVQKLAEVSGLACVPAEDLIEATSDCGAYVMVHSSLKRLAVKLSKICNDLRLLSSGPRAGLNEITCRIAGGSSIMPPRLIRSSLRSSISMFQGHRHDITVTMASEAGQLQLTDGTGHRPGDV